MENYDDNLGGNETQRAETAPTLRRDEMIGTTLDNRYLIEKRLGRGGFGTVYLASDNKAAARKVVVKIMHTEESDNDSIKERFKQEVEALSRLDHPGVVGLFDCGETIEGRPYIVMQHISGVSLRALLTPEGMPSTRVATIMRQIGRALTAAHEAGILHRDLKPENIMVTANGEEHVRVIDFGIAKVKNSIVNVNTARGMVVGTLNYTSPEQLKAEPLTPQSDIYALGVIAFEMLTGRRPNDPESVFHLLELQRAGIRVKPTELRAGLPPAVDHVVLKALSFEPHDRYERAREFGDLLAAALLDQYEPELNEPVPKHSENEAPQMAHVLFMDIVGYSKLLIDEQTRQMQELQDIVIATKECARVRPTGDLIRLPTGDGMALVFFRDPEAPVRAAVEISRALKAHSAIELRMGIHSGLVYRIADINTNMNVAGRGINMAQRVMDCGDNGHILLSKSLADDLGQLARWSEYLDDLGEAEVKHGWRVHLFNLHGDDFGNPDVPAKLQKSPKPRKYKSAVMIGTLSLLVLGLIAGLWYRQIIATRRDATDSSRPPGVVATSDLKPSLTYWLSVQKMADGEPLGTPIQSAGDIEYELGWRLQLNLQSSESGALYLLNAGRGKDGSERYNILFPLPASGQLNPNILANQTAQTGWLRFVNEPGVEKIWIIWSAKSLPDVDAIFSNAAANLGVISNAEQKARIQNYLKQYDPSKLEVVPDKTKQLTSIKGQGDILIGLVELSPKAK